jgi:acyl carrier protein
VEERDVADQLEDFLRNHFSISPSDPRFGRDVDLFDSGYVDSVGLAEMLAFVEDEFGVEVPDDDLVSDEFTTIDGIARVVGRLATG